LEIECKEFGGFIIAGMVIRGFVPDMQQIIIEYFHFQTRVLRLCSYESLILKPFLHNPSHE